MPQPSFRCSGVTRSLPAPRDSSDSRGGLCPSVTGSAPAPGRESVSFKFRFSCLFSVFISELGCVCIFLETPPRASGPGLGGARLSGGVVASGPTSTVCPGRSQTRHVQEVLLFEIRKSACPFLTIRARDGREVERVDVEDVLEAVGGVREEVGAVTGTRRGWPCGGN